MPEYMHRIWLGGEMPARYREYGELWEDLNPHLRLWDWTEEEIMDEEWWNTKVLQDLYNRSRQPGADMVAYYTQVADVIDYELMWKYGGWYFNVDLKPLKPLNTLVHADAALAMEDDVHAVNMAMYGVKNHPFYAAVIDRLPGRYFGMPGAYMNATTGVQLLMQVLAERNWDVTLFHRRIFNPIHFSEFNYGEYPDVDREFHPDTVAVHEWFHRTNQRNQRVL